MTDDVHDLHLRICQLEAALTQTADHVEILRRRWRWALRAGVVVAAATLASVTSHTLRAQAAPPNNETVFTAPFKVVDKNGKIIMLVRESPRGVDFRDDQGNSRITLTPLKTPVMSLGADNDIGVSLGAGMLNGLRVYRGLNKTGVPDEKHPPYVAAALEVDEMEGGKLWVADKAGKNILYAADTVGPGDGRVAIGNSKGGAFGIRVYNSSAGTLLTSMGATKTGESAVAAYDAAGLARVVMFGKDGQFSAMSTEGNPVAQVTSKDNRGRVLVYNSSMAPVVNLTSESSIRSGLVEVTDPAGNRQATLAVDAEGEGKICIMDTKRGELCVGRRELPGMLPGVVH